MPKGMRFVVALVVVGAMALVAPSQEAPAPTKPATDATSQPQKPESESKAEVSVQETTSSFKLRVNLVQVDVVVRGDKGKTVDGLRKEDFSCTTTASYKRSVHLLLRTSNRAKNARKRLLRRR
jgi:hypothetical protein